MKSYHLTHGDHAHCSLGHYESLQKNSAQLVHRLKNYKVMSLIEAKLGKGDLGVESSVH